MFTQLWNTWVFLTTFQVQTCIFPKIGVPKLWMVYFMEKPDLKWMMTGDAPITGNHQKCLLPNMPGIMFAWRS